jgi:hypothetical protein
MDLVPSIWLSSFTGAVLFFAGGRLWGRGAAEAPLPELAAAREARARAEEQAREARDEAERALAEARSQATALGQQLEGERAARGRLEDELRRSGALGARLRERTDELAAAIEVERAARAEGAAELGRAQARAASAEARVAGAEARAASAERRGAAATEEIARLGRALADREGEQRARRAELDDLRPRLGEAEARAADAARLREENAALEAAVAALEQARREAPDLAEVQRRSLEVAMRTRAIEQREAEIDRKDRENVELRRKVEALAGSAHEVAELRARLRDLEARGYAERAHRSAPPPRRAAREPGAPELEASLTLGLESLRSAEDGCRVAVLSDMRGLLVAASGDAEHREELAAAACLTTSAIERLRQLVPLGEAASFAVVDENDVLFRTRWLRWEGECFLLCTMGAAARPEDGEVEALRGRIAELIGGA